MTVNSSRPVNDVEVSVVVSAASILPVAPSQSTWSFPVTRVSDQ